MRHTLGLGLFIGGLMAFLPQAGAADLPPRDHIDTRFDVAPQKRVSVVVDELSLANGCPRDPRCIPPRVLPIVGLGDDRDRTYRMIAIPVDPRYQSRY